MAKIKCLSAGLLPTRKSHQKGGQEIMRTLLFWTALFSNLTLAYSQGNTPFTFEEFIKVVRDNHPVMQKSELIKEAAEAYLLKAKGSFDPKIQHETEGKNFNDKNYYQLSHTALKIPTWFGIEVKGGYEINRGDYVSGEHQTPGSGLWYGGISMPIGKNLFIDERRKTLRQAQVMMDQSEIDQRIMQSDLMLHASEAYWDWYRAYHLLEISKEGLRLAEERLKAVKISAELGEHAQIDTLEASLQRDSRALELEQIKGLYVYYNAGIAVYLWNKDFVPLELKDDAFPPVTDSVVSIYHNVNTDTTVWMKQYDYKLELLKIEERYKKEQLKPEFNVVYNPILQPTGSGFLPFSSNNMKYGFNASFPIFLRKERGDLNALQVKQMDTELDRTVKSLELKNKLIAIRAIIEASEKQLEIQNTVIESSKKMRDAELIKFDLGESSLFLVNSRELKYLESKSKGVELMAKYRSYHAQLNWLQTE
jgi:hypothetical protein